MPCNDIEKMRKYLEREINALRRLDLDAIRKALDVMISAAGRGANIYIFGNGGSGATASHFACDFNKGVYERTGKSFRMICLCDNAPALMAIANDISYDEIFKMQLAQMLRPGDLVIGISGSGNSENVIRAVRYAQSQGCTVIGVTGYDGGKLKELADYSMHVDVNDMQVVEDVHMLFDHMLMRVICGE